MWYCIPQSNGWVPCALPQLVCWLSLRRHSPCCHKTLLVPQHMPLATIFPTLAWTTLELLSHAFACLFRRLTIRNEGFPGAVSSTKQIAVTEVRRPSSSSSSSLRQSRHRVRRQVEYTGFTVDADVMMRGRFSGASVVQPTH